MAQRLVERHHDGRHGCEPCRLAPARTTPHPRGSPARGTLTSLTLFLLCCVPVPVVRWHGPGDLDLGDGDVMASMLWNLRSWPLELVNWPVHNSNRTDIQFLPGPNRSFQTHTDSVRVLPANERNQVRARINERCTLTVARASALRCCSPCCVVCPVCHVHGVLLRRSGGRGESTPVLCCAVLCCSVSFASCMQYVWNADVHDLDGGNGMQEADPGACQWWCYYLVTAPGSHSVCASVFGVRCSVFGVRCSVFGVCFSVTV